MCFVEWVSCLCWIYRCWALLKVTWTSDNQQCDLHFKHGNIFCIFVFDIWIFYCCLLHANFCNFLAQDVFLFKCYVLLCKFSFCFPYFSFFILVLKLLHSIFCWKSLFTSLLCQMKRKDVGISKVYDARALRVIIGDKDGTLHGQAVQCCYNLLDIVHRWKLTVYFPLLLAKANTQRSPTCTVQSLYSFWWILENIQRTCNGCKRRPSNEMHLNNLLYIGLYWRIIFAFSLCRLWTPIGGEFDDYIVNPKPSGYQVYTFSSVMTWYTI